jgi:hypothetical protein
MMARVPLPTLTRFHSEAEIDSWTSSRLFLARPPARLISSQAGADSPALFLDNARALS